MPYTIEQISCACRHVVELVKMGVPENVAIRTFELMVNVYAKQRSGFGTRPDHVDQFDLWSTEAEKYRGLPKHERIGRLRVEHGTPRRAFARLVMTLHEDGELNEQSLAERIAERWRVAVITVEEDTRISDLGLRSTVFEDPRERWRLAGIAFPSP